MTEEVRACRVCAGALDPLLDLGPVVLSSFLDPDQPDPPSVPLDTVVCSRCGLVQLRHTVDPDLLYRRYGYWYQSGISEVMRQELADIATRTSRHRIPDYCPTWLDLGANDGTLLRAIPDAASWHRIAVEPAREFEDRLRETISDVRMDYFPQATADLPRHSVDVISSIACFYNVPDPLAYVAEIDRLLAGDGVWVVQFQDLGQMVEATAFDNICPEHLCTYSASTFATALAHADLGIQLIQRRAINGGSLRFLVGRTKYPHLSASALAEFDRGTDPDSLQHFVWRVAEQKRQIRASLEALLERGQPIDLYGASTKASTLLQACGLNHAHLRYAVERTPEKVGKVTSGTRIPIISEADWRVDPAPLTLCGVWQYREAILKREADYLSRGGSFLLPLPKVEVVCRAVA